MQQKQNQEVQTSVRIIVHCLDFGTPQAAAKAIVKQEIDHGSYTSIAAKTSITPASTNAMPPVLGTVMATSAESISHKTQPSIKAQSERKLVPLVVALTRTPGS